MRFVFLLLHLSICSMGFATSSTHETQSIVVEAKKNLAQASRGAQGKLPSHGVKWGKVISKMREDILRFNTAQEAVNYAQYQGKTGFDHRTSFSASDALAYEQGLKSEFPHFADAIRQVGESRYSTKTAKFNGQIASSMFYYHYRYLLECLTYVEQPKIICEIGSGYGGLARLWMINPIFRPDVCILIDFPECLFFSEVFLKLNFKDEQDVRVVHLHELSMEDLNKLELPYQKTIILCPIGKEHLLNHLPIDLTINTGSMQEMTDVWIDYWMQWLDDARINYFYSLNYGAASIKTRSYEVLGATTWAPRLSKQWSYLLNSSKPHLPPVNFHGFAHIIAVKDKPFINRTALLEQFHMKWEKSWQGSDAQRFLDCLDIVRLLPEQEIIWALLHHIFNDMSFIPRETCYLVKMLKNNADDNFLWSNKRRLKEIEDFVAAFAADSIPK